MVSSYLQLGGIYSFRVSRTVVSLVSSCTVFVEGENERLKIDELERLNVTRSEHLVCGTVVYCTELSCTLSLPADNLRIMLTAYLC